LEALVIIRQPAQLIFNGGPQLSDPSNGDFSLEVLMATDR